jgi:hypothetical protein
VEQPHNVLLGGRLMRLKDIYGNTSATGFSFDFFELTAPRAKSALLASPFYSTYDPVGALTSRGCDVRMIVRLCSVTIPEALRKAHLDPKVTIRYFTDQRFHAKFYVVDDIAMVGSANLTNAGLKTNREVVRRCWHQRAEIANAYRPWGTPLEFYHGTPGLNKHQLL